MRWFGAALLPLLLALVNSQETTKMKPIDACRSNLSYDDIIESLALPNCTSCRGRCGTKSAITDGIPCSCDAVCNQYGDCCLDFRKYCPKEAYNRENSPKEANMLGENYISKSSCYSYSTDKIKYLLISSCPKSHLACKKSLDSASTYVPVYDPLKRLHYINYNCAKCNGVKMPVPWNIYTSCKRDVLEEYGYTNGLNDSDFVNAWNLIHRESCLLIISPDGPSMEPPRLCSDAKRTCHKECPKEELHHRCASDPLMYLKSSHGRFSNLACLLCTGYVIVPHIQCTIVFIAPRRTDGMLSLTVLFDFRSKNSCPDNEIWVDGEEKCRLRACGSEKCKYNGTIVTIIAEVSNHSISDTWLAVTQKDLNGELLYRFHSYKYSYMAFKQPNLLSITAQFGDEYQIISKEVADIIKEFLTLTLGVNYIKTISVYLHNVTHCPDGVGLYKPSEFKFGFNGTINIQDKIKKAGEFYIVNSSAHVCISETSGLNPMSPMAIVTIVFIAISIICLILRIAFHYIFPTESDKVAVRLQLSLCVALLIAFCGFLLRIAAFGIEGFCYFLAVVCHWSFLAAFSWMTVIAIDIVRMLRSSLHLRKVGTRRKSFIVYSLFAWGAPLVILAISIGCNQSDIPVNWKPNYMSKCWLSHKGLLVFFLLPTAILFLVNIVSFLVSTVLLCMYHQESVSKEYKTTKSRLLLHVKILVLMGLTWVFGFLAASVNQDWMWYVFIILNGCQGVFLLFVYVMSKGVKKSLLERTRTFGTSSTNSRSRSISSLNAVK